MREVRITFEHLVVIWGAFMLCLAIIFAIPGVRLWFVEEVPTAVVSMAGPRAMSSFMTGVDPKMLAQAVNDDNTRANMIDLWRQSIAEMEPDALAEVASELLSDPNTSALLINLVAELDPDMAADFCNAFLSDPAVVDKLVAVIPLMDEGVSDFLNELIANEKAETSKFITNVVDKLDADDVVNLAADVVASEGGVRLITDLAKGLLEGPNQQATRELLYKVTDDVAVADLFISILMHNDGQLDDFLKSLFSNKPFRQLLKDALSQATPGGSVQELFQAIQSALFGDPKDPSDGFLDYLWVRASLRQIATYENPWDADHFSDIIRAYIPMGSLLQPLAEPLVEMMGELIGAMLDEVINNMEIWVQISGVHFQEEQPY